MLKRLFYIVLMITACLQLAAQNKVIANITNFRNNAGICRVCIYDNSSAFNSKGGKPVQCVQSRISNNKITATFDRLPDGKYAIFVLHDSNNNNKMDTNYFGIPKEGYGASRNNLPFAAAPGFNDNAFTLKHSETKTLNIRLRNILQ